MPKPMGHEKDSNPTGPEAPEGSGVQPPEKKYDYVIVGGGVAGVLSAEMLLRSGKSVLLIEKEKKISTESSGEQHGWGQFGYLYLNLPDPGVAETCLQNIDVLTNSYPMPGNNLMANEAGELVSNAPDAEGSWYRADPVYYYYPTPEEKSLPLTPKAREEWERKLHNVLLRTKAISEQKWDKSVDLPARKLPGYDEKAGKSLLFMKKGVKRWMRKTAEHKPSGSINQRLTEERAGTTIPTDIVIQSHDRPMRSTRILSSVYNRYTQKGGETALDTQVSNYRTVEDGVELVTDKGTKIMAGKVIFTAGRGLERIKGSNVNTVSSPLLVVSPPVCDRNIVYLTPNSQFTLNHLHHVDPVSGKAYSIIGNGDGIKPDDPAATEESRSNILKQAERLFPKLKDIPEKDRVVYFGYKTEFMASKDNTQARNYHYAFNPIDEHGKVWAAVPGKFTLAPSLAKHIYERLEGPLPPSQKFTTEEERAYLASVREPTSNIAETLHSQVVGDRVGSDKYDPMARAIRSKLKASDKTAASASSPEDASMPPEDDSIPLPDAGSLATKDVAIQTTVELARQMAGVDSHTMDSAQAVLAPGAQTADVKARLDALKKAEASPTADNQANPTNHTI